MKANRSAKGSFLPPLSGGLIYDLGVMPVPKRQAAECATMSLRLGVRRPGCKFHA